MRLVIRRRACRYRWCLRRSSVDQLEQPCEGFGLALRIDGIIEGLRSVRSGTGMEEFRRLTRLPAYVFNITSELKAAARKRGEDIVDFGMGNPDGATPRAIVDKLIEAGTEDADASLLAVAWDSGGCGGRSATGIRRAMTSIWIRRRKRL